MPLVTLHHPVPSFANALRRFDRSAIVYDPRLFVLSPALVRFDLCSVSELLAYRVADLIQMPHLPYVGFWCPDPVYLRKGMGGSGRIGIALEWNGTPCLSYGWCNRAHRHPNTVAKALVLSALRFGREVQMALTRKRRYVAFDLGGLMPPLVSETDGVDWTPWQRKFVMEKQIDAFQRGSGKKIDAVLDDAERYGVLNRVSAIVERVLDTPFDELLSRFDVSPHPFASEISFAAARAVQEQFEWVAECV